MVVLRLAARVAALPWNQWQLSRGMGGTLRLESVAGLVWNTRMGFNRILICTTDKHRKFLAGEKNVFGGDRTGRAKNAL